MAFFIKRDPVREAGAAQDADRLARGLLPLRAERRLSGRAAFSAAFSPSEFALLAGDDVLPVGIVSGSSVVQVGPPAALYYESAEMTTETAAHLMVRRRALDRLAQEAALVNAHGVVGVTFRHRAQAADGQTGELLEFSATGTAIRLLSGEPPPRPFLCTLSASEFWTLRRAGYRPCGIALGLCSWYHVSSPALRNRRLARLGRGPLENQEYGEYSEAVRHARGLAAERALAEAARGTAGGVLGLSLTPSISAPRLAGEDSSFRRLDLVIRVHAQGTAITPHRDRWPLIDYAVPLTG